jgi:drug/metabolite transporter (DMT)-like permease
MAWISLAVVSYLMLAIVNIGDKVVVDKLLKSGQVYAFVVGVLSALVFVLAPWFLEWPGIFLFLINLLAGAFFIFALWSMFEALKAGEASRVVVVVGSIVPIFSLIFSVLIFKESFSFSQWMGLLFLLAGMVVMSFITSRRKKWPTFLRRLQKVFYGEYNKRWIFLAILAAFLYSLFFISTKYAYNHQPFWSSFIWIRLGGLIVVFLFLLDRDTRKEIRKKFRAKPHKSTKLKKSFVLFNQVLGSLAFILQNYAVYLGPVALINALQGVQYAFLLLIGIFSTIFFPKILKEDISKKVLIKKVLAIILVAIGLYFITI